MNVTLSIHFNTRMEPASFVNRENRTEARIPVQVISNSQKGSPIRAMVPLRYGKQEVSVPLGLYQVQATLPNGTVLSETVDATDPKQTKPIEVEFDLREESPNESAGWAYLLGTARRRPRLGPAFIASSRSGSGAGAMEHEVAYMKFDAPLRPIFQLWLEPKPGYFQPDPEPHRRRETLSPYNDPNAAVEIRSHIRVDERLWLEATDPRGKSIFTMLPPSAEDGDTRALILDSASVSQPGACKIVVESGGEAAASLLSYVRNGRLEAAHQAAEDFLPAARELLRGKFRDFTSAVIAGYYLHKVGAWAEPNFGGQSRETWFAWLKNLNEEFPLYADGAVIHAWALLTSGESNLAREHFDKAILRGLPMFTQGVRMLLNGVQFLNSLFPDDRNIGRRLMRLQHQISAIDWSAPNTTLHGRIQSGALIPQES